MNNYEQDVTGNCELKKLLLPADFAANPARYHQTIAEIDRPRMNTWLRVRPEAAGEPPLDALAVKHSDHGWLLVPHDAAVTVTFLLDRGELRRVRLYTYVYRDGRIGFWPLNLEGLRGRALDTWSASGHQICEAARNRWVSFKAGNASYLLNDELPDHTVYPDPVFPQNVAELLVKSAKDRTISSMDHPVILTMQGRA